MMFSSFVLGPANGRLNLQRRRRLGYHNTDAFVSATAPAGLDSYQSPAKGSQRHRHSPTKGQRFVFSLNF